MRHWQKVNSLAPGRYDSYLKKCNFQTCLPDWCIKQCSQMTARELPVPMLTHIYVTIRSHWVEKGYHNWIRYANTQYVAHFVQVNHPSKNWIPVNSDQKNIKEINMKIVGAFAFSNHPHLTQAIYLHYCWQCNTILIDKTSITSIFVKK